MTTPREDIANKALNLAINSILKNGGDTAEYVECFRQYHEFLGAPVRKAKVTKEQIADMVEVAFRKAVEAKAVKAWIKPPAAPQPLRQAPQSPLQTARAAKHAADRGLFSQYALNKLMNEQRAEAGLTTDAFLQTEVGKTYLEPRTRAPGAAVQHALMKREGYLKGNAYNIKSPPPGGGRGMTADPIPSPGGVEEGVDGLNDGPADAKEASLLMKLATDIMAKLNGKGGKVTLSQAIDYALHDPASRAILEQSKAAGLARSVKLHH